MKKIIVAYLSALIDSLLHAALICFNCVLVERTKTPHLETTSSSSYILLESYNRAVLTLYTGNCP